MSILTAAEILKEYQAGAVEIDPFDLSRLGPNSYDVTLAPDLLVYSRFPLDVRLDNPTEQLTIPEEGLPLFPHRLYLARTVERVGSRKYVVNLDGRSSIGRLGISIHQTAGRGDLGFVGSTWTLEITVVHPVRIYPGLRIGQATFNTVEGDVSRQYQGKYVGQQGPTASRSWRDEQ